jgi:hypothetical protein
MASHTRPAVSVESINEYPGPAKPPPTPTVTGVPSTYNMPNKMEVFSYSFRICPSFLLIWVTE